MDDWSKGNDSFKKTPPNAAIVHAALKTNDKGIAQAIPVELMNPVITTNGWTFDLLYLQGNKLEGRLEGVSLFVDPAFVFGR
ncbi:MAG: hypothetical protein NTY13_00555 [Chlamydiae bacterium]|nr:hypothetical protein [Chlamydiota bacterium]